MTDGYWDAKRRKKWIEDEIEEEKRIMGSYKTICIDFDGVISSYDSWKGIGVFGEPIDGVREGIQKLKDAGYNIVIHTTRGEVELIRTYLESHSIPFDHINHNPQNFEHMNPGKPIADVYIDDRAICFKGNWGNDFIEKIINHKPWYKK